MFLNSLPRAVLCAGLLAALAGCATQTGQARPEGAAAARATTSADSLAQTRWELTGWVDALGNRRNIPHGDNGEPISLTFLADGKRYAVRGFSGCNRYNGTYRLEAGKLSITRRRPRAWPARTPAAPSWSSTTCGPWRTSVRSRWMPAARRAT